MTGKHLLFCGFGGQAMGCCDEVEGLSSMRMSAALKAVN